MFTLAASVTRKDAALRGVLALVLGVVFVIWPGITIGTAAALFAIVIGVLELAASGGRLRLGRCARVAACLMRRRRRWWARGCQRDCQRG